MSVILQIPYWFQGYAVAQSKNRAFVAVAALAIIDLAAIALVEPALRTETPDGVLHKPGEVGREGWVEAAGIDVTGDAFEDLSAAGRCVAGGSIRVSRAEPDQDAGPMQKIVHQGVDGDHDGAGFCPEGPFAIPASRSLASAIDSTLFDTP